MEFTQCLTHLIESVECGAVLLAQTLYGKTEQKGELCTDSQYINPFC